MAAFSESEVTTTPLRATGKAGIQRLVPPARKSRQSVVCRDVFVSLPTGLCVIASVLFSSMSCTQLEQIIISSWWLVLQ